MRLFIPTLVLLMATTANASSPYSVHSVPTVTFEELFGMNETAAAGMFQSTTFGCLKHALADFNLAATGNHPKYSKLETSAADGGTTNWRGDCYDLTILMHGVRFKDGKGCYLGFVFGPSLKIRDPDEWPASISRTKLVTVEPEPCH